MAWHSKASDCGLCLQAVRETGNQVLSFEDVVAMGQKRVYQPEPPQPSELSTIMYTSGTTGLHKSVTDSMVDN